MEFDPPGPSPSLRLVSSLRELVCSLDMMTDTHRSHTCFLAPGDAVLSPWEPEMQRYGPGRVTAAMQSRDGTEEPAEEAQFTVNTTRFLVV